MRHALIVAAALAVGFAAGCKNESTTTPGGSSTPPGGAGAGSGSATPATMPATMPAMSEAAKGQMESATRSAGDLADRAGAGLSGAATRAGLPPDGGAAAAKDQAAGATGGMQAEAQKYYDQAMQAVKDKKFDVADEALKKLEGMKSNLSPEWQSKVDSARTMLDGAKSAGSIPGLGGK